jgi:hypothetical protein
MLTASPGLTVIGAPGQLSRLFALPPVEVVAAVVVPVVEPVAPVDVVVVPDAVVEDDEPVPVVAVVLVVAPP